MSPQQRLRVLFSDGQAAQPDKIIVLFRQRVAWAMLLGSFLALLCLPAHRRLFLAQVEAVRTRTPPAWAVTSTQALSDQRVIQHRARLLATLRSHLKDAWLQIGAIALGGIKGQGSGAEARRVAYTGTVDPTLEYLQQLRARFPGNKLVVGILMRTYCEQHVKVRRAEGRDRSGSPESAASPSGQTRLLSPALVPRVEGIAAEGARLDPDNGYSQTMLAVAYFAAGQDEDGLRMLHRAAPLPHWDDYSTAEAAAGRDLMIQTYGDQGLWMHLLPRAKTYLRYLYQVRASARVAQWQARQAGARGDLEKEHRVRTDLIHLGGQIRRQAPTVMGRAVGAALQDLGFGVDEPVRPGVLILRSPDEEEQKREKQRWAYRNQVRREAPRFAQGLEAEGKALRQFRTGRQPDELPWLASSISKTWLRREVLGLALLANWLAVFSIVFLVEIVRRLLQRRRREERRDRWTLSLTTMPSPLRVTLVGLAPFVVLLLCERIVPIWSRWGWQLPAVAFGLLLIPAVRRREGAAINWSATHGLLVALLALGIVAVAAGPWGLDVLWDGFWREASAGDGYVFRMVNAEPLKVLGAGWIIGPAPVFWGLVPAAVLAALLRRASLGGVVSALHGGAKVLTGVLAATYIVYLILTVPANANAVLAFEEVIRQLS